SLAFSWSFQNVGLTISCSTASRRACFSPRSKRVSQMEDLVDRALGDTFQIGVHSKELLNQNRCVSLPRGAAFVSQDRFRYTLSTESLNPIARFSARGTSIGIPTQH